jgi:hypothetical protein
LIQRQRYGSEDPGSVGESRYFNAGGVCRKHLNPLVDLFANGINEQVAHRGHPPRKYH